MQWGLIFGHESVLGDFSKITESEKILIGAAYLYRQKRLIQLFDSRYTENLSSNFEEGVIECIKEDREVDAMRLNLEGIIPDTEEFPDQEGAYAQNLLIALSYLLLFSKSSKPKEFEGSIGMALENIDLISYEMDEKYSYESMLGNERKIASLMIGRLRDFNKSQLDLDLVSRICIDFNI